jgi:hypothetical protein
MYDVTASFIAHFPKIDESIDNRLTMATGTPITSSKHHAVAVTSEHKLLRPSKTFHKK